jgi:hypothetical protein
MTEAPWLMSRRLRSRPYHSVLVMGAVVALALNNGTLDDVGEVGATVPGDALEGEALGPPAAVAQLQMDRCSVVRHYRHDLEPGQIPEPYSLHRVVHGVLQFVYQSSPYALLRL